MAVLLVPGFMLDRDLWRDMEQGLQRFGPLLHADLSQDDTIAAMARRALQEAPSSFVVAGFSMGGYVAREILRQAPERVSALVLIASSARGDGDLQRRRKAALEAEDGAGPFRSLSDAAVASSLHPAHTRCRDIIDRIKAMGQRLGAEVFRRQSLLERHDERGLLAEIGCPSLVIAGGEDRLRTRAEALELHQGIAGSHFAVIADAGHMIPLEAPGRLVDAIADWLEERSIGRIDASDG